MKPAIETLGKILYSPSQYIIPVFQRQYRWEKPEWEKLWESLEEIQQPTKTGNHFMGFLVFMPGLPQPGRHTMFHLIDGQQRITTLSILLAAIRNIARQAKQRDLASEIHDYYLVHPLKKGEDYLRLLPKVRDSRDYKVVITGKGEPNGRVGQALLFFQDKLADVAEQKNGYLRELFNAITQRLEFMCATLETENAYNIFKSLNSIGVPLEQSDLIRNFVFMHMAPDDHDDFDHEAWAPLERRFIGGSGTLDEDRFSRFFRDFLMSDGDYIPPVQTFATFESRYEATNFSPRELADLLDRYAEYYEVISGTKHDTDKAVTHALEGLNALESSTTYPLLLKLFSMRYEGKLNSRSLTEAIEMLRGFIMRRFITSQSSRGYGRLFLRACKLKHDDSLQELNKFLIARTWPDDRRFQEAFVQFPLYERGYARHILETLERASLHKEPADLTESQIEHIMPQTLNDVWRKELGDEWERIHVDWLHRPGNLALTGYNAPLSNAPFEKKREFYTDSNIVTTRQLADFSGWGEVEMRSRSEKLAEQATIIWTGPRPVATPPKIDMPSKHTPNDQEADLGGLTKTKRLQLEFWRCFQDLVAERSDIIKARKAQPQHWADFAIGRWEFYLIASMDSRKRIIGVSLALVGPNAKQHFHLLENRRKEIEQVIGEPISWSELPDKKSSYISLYREDSSLRDKDTWLAQHTWLLEKLELFHRTFSPIVMSINIE